MNFQPGLSADAVYDLTVYHIHNLYYSKCWIHKLQGLLSLFRENERLEYSIILYLFFIFSSKLEMRDQLTLALENLSLSQIHLIILLIRSLHANCKYCQAKRSVHKYYALCSLLRQITW